VGSEGVELLDDLNYQGNFKSAENRALNTIAAFNAAGGLAKWNQLLGKKHVQAPAMRGPRGNRRQLQEPRGDGGSSDDDAKSDGDDIDGAGGAADDLSNSPRFVQLLHLASSRGTIPGVVSIFDELCSVGATNDVAAYICGLKKDQHSRMSGKNLAIDIIFKIKFHPVKVGDSCGYITGHKYIVQKDTFRRTKPVVQVAVAVDGTTQWVAVGSVQHDPLNSAIFVAADAAVLFGPYIDAAAAKAAQEAANAAAAVIPPGPERAVQADDPLPFQRNDAVRYLAGRGEEKIEHIARVARWDQTRNAFVVQVYLKNGERQRYANEVTREAAGLSKIDTETMIKLQWKGDLPPLPPLRSISNKEKQTLNVLCTCCELQPTPEEAHYCECFEEDTKKLWERQRPVPEGKKWSYVCDSPVCVKLLLEHQANCAKALAAADQVDEPAEVPEPMDVAPQPDAEPHECPIPAQLHAQQPLASPAPPPAAHGISTVIEGVHTISLLVRTLYRERTNLVPPGLLVTTYNEDPITACRYLGKVTSVHVDGKHCSVSWLDGGVNGAKKKVRKTNWDMGELSFVETKQGQHETDLMALRNGSYCL